MTGCPTQAGVNKLLTLKNQGIWMKVCVLPSNNLCIYLESKPDLNLNSLLATLQCYFQEKDSLAVFTELGNAVQQATETAFEFVIRLKSMQQKVLELSRAEGCLYDENLLQKRFFHAMFTGIRNAN